MPLNEVQTAEALMRLAHAVEPCMPDGAMVEPHEGARVHVTVHLNRAPNRIGREVSVVIGPQALERYYRMDGQDKLDVERTLQRIVRQRMQHYDDGRAAPTGTVFEPFVIDVRHDL